MTLDGLCKAVAARIKGGAMTAAMIVLVWTRSRRTEARLQGLLRRFLAGRLPVRTVTPTRPGGGGGRSGGMGRGLPRRFAWLIPLVPYEAACFAGQLRAVLAEPEMDAMIKASPQARRALAPLCRMLGIEASVLAPASAAGSADVTAPTEAAIGRRAAALPPTRRPSEATRKLPRGLPRGSGGWVLSPSG